MKINYPVAALLALLFSLTATLRADTLLYETEGVITNFAALNLPAFGIETGQNFTGTIFNDDDGLTHFSMLVAGNNFVSNSISIAKLNTGEDFLSWQAGGRGNPWNFWDGNQVIWRTEGDLFISFKAENVDQYNSPYPYHSSFFIKGQVTTLREVPDVSSTWILLLIGAVSAVILRSRNFGRTLGLQK